MQHHVAPGRPDAEFGERHRLELLDASETAVTGLMPGKPCHGFGESLRKAAVEVALHVARVENQLQGAAGILNPHVRDVAREVHVGLPFGRLRREAEHARLVVDDDLPDGPEQVAADNAVERKLGIDLRIGRCDQKVRMAVDQLADPQRIGRGQLDEAHRHARNRDGVGHDLQSDLLGIPLRDEAAERAARIEDKVAHVAVHLYGHGVMVAASDRFVFQRHGYGAVGPFETRCRHVGQCLADALDEDEPEVGFKRQ